MESGGGRYWTRTFAARQRTMRSLSRSGYGPHQPVTPSLSMAPLSGRKWCVGSGIQALQGEINDAGSRLWSRDVA